MSSNRIVINTATRQRPPVIIILDPAGSRAGDLLGTSSWARTIRAMMAMGLVGALLNQIFGVGVALVLAILVLPVLAGLAAMSWASRGDRAETALQTTLLATLAVPVLAFPGVLLGWMGAPLWAIAAGLANALLSRLASR
jgi:hypothetical protein